LLVISRRFDIRKPDLPACRFNEGSKVAPRHPLPSLGSEEFEQEEDCEEGESKDENDERGESDSTKRMRMCRGDEIAP
jgi:hypothetical protein